MPVVTKASEHVVAGLPDERYCNISDVRNELRGVAVDDPANNQDLGAWVSSVERNDVLLRALIDARLWVNYQTRRDFDYHTDVEVVMDGSGDDTMHLDNAGFLPVASVEDLKVNGAIRSLGDYAIYPSDGKIKWKRTHRTSRYAGRTYEAFPMGTQNVAMTLTWGYVEVPRDIVVAQARKAAAFVLDQLERANLSSGDISPGFREVDYGDVRIRMGDSGRYGQSIRRLDQQALETCLRYRVPIVSSARANFRGKPIQPGG